MAALNNTTVLWSIMIGVGAIVTACVVILLSLLSAIVRDIDRHVATVGAQLEHLAGNTRTHPHLRETARLITALEAELQAHSRALTGRPGAR